MARGACASQLFVEPTPYVVMKAAFSFDQVFIVSLYACLNVIHAVASAVRCRKDGSKIESVHGFFAFNKTADGWKMYAVADTTF